MARLKFPQSIEDAPEASRPALKAVSQQLGFTPNSFKLMSLSPSALSGVVALQGALGRTIDARTRDIVALAVSQASGCGYCLSAHSHTAAQFNHATAEQIALARQGRSDDPKRQAAGTFARRVVEERGKVPRGNDYRSTGPCCLQCVSVGSAQALASGWRAQCPSKLR
jgi:AhpD family alkylhydroperoxidase